MEREFAFGTSSGYEVRAERIARLIVDPWVRRFGRDKVLFTCEEISLAGNYRQEDVEEALLGVGTLPLNRRVAILVFTARHFHMSIKDEIFRCLRETYFGEESSMQFTPLECSRIATMSQRLGQMSCALPVG